MTVDASDRFSGYPFGNYTEPEGPSHARASEWDEAAPSSSRFNIVNSLALPGKCAVCGYSGGEDDNRSDYRRKFVDFGFDLDFYGVVGFCTACVSEMAGVLGFIARKEYESYQSENSTLKAQLQETRIANDQLRATIHTLSSPTSQHIVGEVAYYDVKIGDSEATKSEQSSDKSPSKPRPDDRPSIISGDTGDLNI